MGSSEVTPVCILLIQLAIRVSIDKYRLFVVRLLQPKFLFHRAEFLCCKSRYTPSSNSNLDSFTDLHIGLALHGGTVECRNCTRLTKIMFTGYDDFIDFNFKKTSFQTRTVLVKCLTHKFKTIKSDFLQFIRSQNAPWFCWKHRPSSDSCLCSFPLVLFSFSEFLQTLCQLHICPIKVELCKLSPSMSHKTRRIK